MLSEPTVTAVTTELDRVPFALMYHSVTGNAEDRDEVTVSAARFVRQMAWLRRCGLRGVSMRDLLYAAKAGRDARLVGLTFDDGYADFLTEVLPVLRQYGFGATVFAVAGHLGGQNDWATDGPVKPLLEVEHLRFVAATGIEVGSHGLSHRPLAGAGPTVLWQELAQSRAILSAVLGVPVHGFCYPYGDLSDATMAAAADYGYRYAVATRATGRPDRYAVPRTHVGQADIGPRLLAKLARHRLTWRTGGRR
jgi:peptidoglycan/xylan/chitin deacetylase (PgdA/CDA1 family)